MSTRGPEEYERNRRVGTSMIGRRKRLIASFASLISSEAYLLEVLSDFQVTIPELGTITAKDPPLVVITSNRTREIHDALKRRCFYHWVDYPSANRELEIIKIKVPSVSKTNLGHSIDSTYYLTRANGKTGTA